MPTTTSGTTVPALDALCRPIRDYAPEDAAGHAFRAGMLGLTDLLSELWDDDEGSALEDEVVWTALRAFPGLIAPGPSPSKLVESIVIDAEAADTLHTLGTVRRILEAYEPPGFAAALWRAVLLAIYRLIEVLVMHGDEDATNRCLELLETAEEMADSLAGRA